MPRKTTYAVRSEDPNLQQHSKTFWQGLSDGGRDMLRESRGLPACGPQKTGAMYMAGYNKTYRGGK